MNGGGFNFDDQLPSTEETPQVVNVNDSFYPVTIKSILNAESRPDGLYFGDTQRKQVAVVGQLISISSDNISFKYTIDDSTGVIFLRDYSEEDTSYLVEGCYIFAIGRVTSEQERTISAYGVRLITDFNAVIFHMVNALYMELHAQRGLPPNSAFNQQNANFNNNQNDQKNPMPQIQDMRAQSASRDQSLKDSILEIIRKSDRTQGVSKSKITAQLGTLYPVKEILSTIDSLIFNGDIYNGNDDNVCLI